MPIDDFQRRVYRSPVISWLVACLLVPPDRHDDKAIPKMTEVVLLVSGVTIAVSAVCVRQACLGTKRETSTAARSMADKETTRQANPREYGPSGAQRMNVTERRVLWSSMLQLLVVLVVATAHCYKGQIGLKHYYSLGTESYYGGRGGINEVSQRRGGAPPAVVIFSASYATRISIWLQEMIQHHAVHIQNDPTAPDIFVPRLLSVPRPWSLVPISSAVKPRAN